MNSNPHHEESSPELDLMLSQAGRLSSMMRDDNNNNSNNNNMADDVSVDTIQEAAEMEAMLARAGSLLDELKSPSPASSLGAGNYIPPPPQSSSYMPHHMYSNATTTTRRSTPMKHNELELVPTVSMDEDDDDELSAVGTMLLKAKILSKTIKSSLDTPELLRTSDDVLRRANMPDPSPPDVVVDTPTLLDKADRLLASSPTDTIATVDSESFEQEQRDVMPSSVLVSSSSRKPPRQPRATTPSVLRGAYTGPTPKARNSGSAAEAAARAEHERLSRTGSDAVITTSGGGRIPASPQQPLRQPPASVSLQTIDADDMSSVGSESCYYGAARLSFLENLNNSASPNNNNNKRASPRRGKQQQQDLLSKQMAQAEHMAKQMAQALEETLSDAGSLTVPPESPVVAVSTPTSSTAERDLDRHVESLTQLQQRPMTPTSLSDGDSAFHQAEVLRVQAADKHAKWVKVQSALPGDDDYAPLKDYLKKGRSLMVGMSPLRMSSSPASSKCTVSTKCSSTTSSRSLMVGHSPSPMRRYKSRSKIVPLVKKRSAGRKNRVRVIGAGMLALLLYWILSKTWNSDNSLLETTKVDEESAAPVTVASNKEKKSIQKKIEEMERELQRMREEEELQEEAPKSSKSRVIDYATTVKTTASIDTPPAPLRDTTTTTTPQVAPKPVVAKPVHHVKPVHHAKPATTTTTAGSQAAAAAAPESSTISMVQAAADTVKTAVMGKKTVIEPPKPPPKACFIPLAYVVASPCRKQPLFDAQALADSMME